MNCGTWTAIGVVTKEPVINETAFYSGLTNYGLPDGRYMFGTTMLGLIYLQRYKEEWEKKGENLSFEEMAQLAQKAKSFQVDLSSPLFQNSNLTVTEKIDCFFMEQGREGPATKGEYIRCILESLTDEYHNIIDALEKATGICYSKIYMGGGGTKNSLLLNLLQKKTKKEIRCTDSEVTVLGNFLSQLVAAGEIEKEEVASLSKKISCFENN